MCQWHVFVYVKLIRNYKYIKCDNEVLYVKNFDALLATIEGQQFFYVL